MSAERLRAAAARLRGAAEEAAAKPGPTQDDLDAIRSLEIGAIFVAPSIALALADWLDVQATASPTGWTDPQTRYEESALTVADAILGADS